MRGKAILCQPHLMQMAKTRIVATALILAATWNSADADLIRRDLYEPGDGLVTLDTDTNLEWLDGSVRNSYTLYQFTLGLTGLESLGFRYATDDEIRQLLANAGADVPEFWYGGDPPLTTANNFQAWVALEHLTVTYPVIICFPYPAFMLDWPDFDGDSRTLYVFGDVNDVEQTAALIENAFLAVHEEWALPSLVRVVPIPAAAWLFASALGLLGWMRRRTS